MSNRVLESDFDLEFGDFHFHKSQHEDAVGQFRARYESGDIQALFECIVYCADRHLWLAMWALRALASGEHGAGGLRRWLHEHPRKSAKTDSAANALGRALLGKRSGRHADPRTKVRDVDRVDRIYAAIEGTRSARLRGKAALEQAIIILHLWGIDAANSPNGLRSLKQTYRQRSRAPLDSSLPPVAWLERQDRVTRFIQMAQLISRGAVRVTSHAQGAIEGRYLLPQGKGELIIRQRADGTFEVPENARLGEYFNESYLEKGLRQIKWRERQNKT